eukprot:2064642-Prymnesium_polylepis.1
MIGNHVRGKLESELEMFYLATFVGLLQPPTLTTRQGAMGLSLPALPSIHPGPAAEGASASDGRRRRQPA